MLAWPALLAIDFALAVLRGFRPARVEFVVFGAAAALALLTIGVACTRRGQMTLRHRAPQLLAIAASLTLAIVAAELALRWRLGAPPAFHLRAPHEHTTFSPQAGVMPGIDGTSTFTTEEHGLRGPSWSASDTFRILCIGGSTTECLYLDDREAWPALLMDQLTGALGAERITVGNAGRSGFAMPHHLAFVRDSSIAASASCIVVQAGINDFMRAVGGADDRDDPHLQAQPLCYSAQLLRSAYRLLRPPPALDIEGRAGQEYADRRARRQQAPIVDALPDLEPALQRYATQLRELHALCAARGITLVCTTQPVLWRDDLPASASALLWLGRTASGAYLSVGALRHGIDQFDATTRASGVPCVDLTALNGRAELFYDDCHFNEAGAREVAGRVGAWLLERRPWR